MEILRFNPKNYWLMSGTDYSSVVGGSPVTFESNAVPDQGVALTSNVLTSLLLKAEAIAKYPNNPIIVGLESNPFSLAMTFYPINEKTSAQQLMSNFGTFDGLWRDKNVIHFTTIHTGFTADCSYNIQGSKKVFAVGVHTPNKNSLFINGELVSEVDISDLTSYNINASANNLLYSGSDSHVLVNEVAIFERALDGSEIATIYNDQNRGTEGNVSSMFNGEDIGVSSPFRVPKISMEWKDEGDWDRALQVNCITDDDLLIPEADTNGLSKNAQWLTSRSIYSGSESLTLNAVNVDYTGYGATVSISFDGITWTEVNGTISQTFNPYKKDIYVKVDFAAGLVDAFLDNLRIDFYTNTSYTTKNGRVVTYNLPLSILREYPAYNLDNKWGVRVSSGGSISISNPAPKFRTLEIWLRPDADFDVSPLVASGGASYINGVAGTIVKKNVWNLVHISNPTVYSSDLLFSTPSVYGKFGLYGEQLSASTIANIYKTYLGKITSTITDTFGLAVTENATPVVVYDNNYATLTGLQ